MSDRPNNDPPELRRTKRLGAVLQQLMARANLRQNELARRSGVASASLTNYLRGHTRAGKPTFPTPDILREIAWGLGTNGLGERDKTAADAAYGQMMTAIGYLDAPSLVHAPPLPREVLNILEDNPELPIQIFQAASDWSPEATEMLIQAINEYKARIVQRSRHPGECAQ